MPGIEDWASSPLSVIDQAFQSHLKDGSAWPSSVEKYFEEKLSQDNLQLVSINEVPNHMLSDGQLVRFRCMIQDMFDPEIFLDQYTVKNIESGEQRFHTCRYRDMTNFRDNEEAVQENMKHSERQSFYCISIPGESPWVKDCHKKRSPVACHPSTSSAPIRSKRSLDEEDDHENTEDKTMETSTTENKMDDNDGQDEVKKIKPAETTSVNGTTSNGVIAAQPMLNFPIPKSKGQAVICKVYNAEDGTFKLNDLVEFIGIVSLDPQLAAVGEDMDTDDISAQFNKSEIQAKNPPASLIPRLHVLKYNKLEHSNPSLPKNLATYNACWEELRRSRDELHSLMTTLLFGDSLAAEYMLAHFMSRIYHRQDGLCLGKYSLNLFNVPILADYSKRLATLLQLLVTKSHYFPLTVEELNKATFVPKKDYASNRLTSGLLQLSQGTHLILDETKMNNGQLNQEGIKNLTSLGQMIKTQSVDYDFGFHNLAFDSDVPCLVLSEGRSMLPNDVQVMMKPQTEVSKEAVDALFANVGRNLELEMLSRVRNYISLAKNLAFDLTEETQNFVQEDFVRERQNGDLIKTTDDLHSLLVFGRLLSVSRGEKALNPSVWNEAKLMEQQRKSRSSHLPTRPQM